VTSTAHEVPSDHAARSAPVPTPPGPAAGPGGPAATRPDEGARPARPRPLQLLQATATVDPATANGLFEGRVVSWSTGEGVAGAEQMSAVARALAQEYRQRLMSETKKLDSRLVMATALFFFIPYVIFKGAFNNDNWAAGWTFMSQAGYFGNFNFIVGAEASALAMPASFDMNVQTGTTGMTVLYRVPETRRINIAVYDVTGRKIATLTDRVHRPGFFRCALPAADIASGYYVLRMSDGRNLMAVRSAMMIK
jgi:hypothetical protein